MPNPVAPMNTVPHVSVCICTYKRPELLARLLFKLRNQATENLFAYSIVVTDNDHLQSAQPAVSSFTADSSVRVVYCVEPRRSIALARNKAVANATGDFIGFLDDDEFPAENWLLILFRTLKQYRVDGVLGPVRRHFDHEPPEWLRKSGLYERPVNPTGSPVRWREARTGNVLLKKQIFDKTDPPFRRQFRALEDQDFFQRMIEQGHTFVWSAEAVVYESVPPLRWRKRYMLRKALLFGSVAPLQSSFGVMSIAKSLVAAATYTLFLPVALVFGYHRFVSLLVKLFHHLGKLLAVAGIDPVSDQYVTEE